MICRTGDLTLEVNPAICASAEVLDGVAEYFVITDHCLHIIGGIDRGREETNLGNGTRYTASSHKIAHLKRTQHNKECTCGKVRQQPRPGGSDRNTCRGDQCSKGGCLNAEITQYADDQ